MSYRLRALSTEDARYIAFTPKHKIWERLKSSLCQRYDFDINAPLPSTLYGDIAVHMETDEAVYNMSMIWTTPHDAIDFHSIRWISSIPWDTRTSYPQEIHQYIDLPLDMYRACLWFEHKIVLNYIPSRIICIREGKRTYGFTKYGESVPITSDPRCLYKAEIKQIEQRPTPRKVEFFTTPNYRCTLGTWKQYEECTEKNPLLLPNLASYLHSDKLPLFGKFKIRSET